MALYQQTYFELQQTNNNTTQNSTMLVNYTDNVSGNLCYIKNLSAPYVAPTSIIATSTGSISDTTITTNVQV